MSVFYEVNECSNEGAGRLSIEFSKLEDAIDWVNKAQEKADSIGNPRDLCYDVFPSGSAVYNSFSRICA